MAMNQSDFLLFGNSGYGSSKKCKISVFKSFGQSKVHLGFHHELAPAQQPEETKMRYHST